MRKQEFIQTLSNYLGSYKDKKEVLDYYEEIIDDRVCAGEKEEAIIESFGDIRRIAYKISGSESKEEVKDNRIFYTERVEKSNNKVNGDEAIKETNSNMNKGNVNKVDRIDPVKLILVLILIPALATTVCSVLGAVFGAFCGLFGGGAGSVIGGIFGIIASAFQFQGNPGALVSNIGICLAVIAVGFLLIVLGINIASFLIKLVIRFFKWFIGLFQKGGWIYEK